MTDLSAPQHSRAFDLAAPLVFVGLWSTGWIVARYCADYGDPLTFLCVRFAAAGVVLAIYAQAVGAQWPRGGWNLLHVLIAGVLLHAFYLGPVWWAVRQGVPASISALLAATQPIATAALGPFLLGERASLRRWLGAGVGFLGVAIVLQPKLALAAPGSGFAFAVMVNLIGMASTTAGFFYQKRFVRSSDMRATAAVQYAAALLALAPFAFALEPMRITWNLTMILTLAWSVLALSIGAILLLLVYLRRGEVSRTAQFIYLVPPASALESWLLFGETLTSGQIVGMVITAAGVALAVKG